MGLAVLILHMFRKNSTTTTTPPHPLVVRGSLKDLDIMQVPWESLEHNPTSRLTNMRSHMEGVVMASLLSFTREDGDMLQYNVRKGVPDPQLWDVEKEQPLKLPEKITH